MAFRNGPTFPAIQDGLLYHIDPLDSRYYGGGTTIQSSISPYPSGSIAGGVLTNTAPWPDGYMDYDGTDDKINLELSSQLEASTGTAMVWFNSDAVNETVGLFKYGASNAVGSDGWYLGLRSNNLYVMLANGGYWEKFSWSNVSLSNSTWYQYAATWVGSTNVNVYLDGTFRDNATPTKTPTFVGATGAIGYHSYSSKYFNGKIGPVALYNRVLTADEILKSYNQLKNRFQ